MDNTNLYRRAQEFGNLQGLTLEDELGAGVQGIVFSAKSQSKEGQSAIKVHRQETDYRRERDAYFRLQEHGITTLRGCNIPELIAYHDELLILEMTVVSRPFILRFWRRLP